MYGRNLRKLEFQLIRLSLGSRFAGGSLTLAAQFEPQRLDYLLVGLRLGF